MYRQLTLVLLVGAATLSLSACNNYPNDSTANADRSSTTPPRTQKPVAPDNTAKNRPENAPSDKTASDQLENKSDITITAEIRRGIMKKDDMSITAQNVKIITENGVVTLQGPVNTQAEKDAIGALATSVAGVIRVDNLLEVKTGA